MSQVQPVSDISHEPSDIQGGSINPPVMDYAFISTSSSEGRKISREDIELVQNLIERCLQLYMTKEEVVKTLSTQARIDPGFTSLVWQKLEEGNADFFKAYYIRLKLKKQIILFNSLLEHQCELMTSSAPLKASLAPLQERKSSTPGDTVESPIFKQTSIPASGQPQLNLINCDLADYNALDGVNSPDKIQFMQENSMNEMSTRSGEVDVNNIPRNDLMPPSVVASNAQFPFPLDIPGGGPETSTIDATYTSGMTCDVDFRLQSDVMPGNMGSFRSFAQIPWNFSLSDLTDFVAMENYDNPSHRPADSNVVHDSSEQGHTGRLR